MAFPNIAKKSNWLGYLSNMPNVDGKSDDDIKDMRLFDSNIKSWTSPDLAINTLISSYQNMKQIQLDPNGNAEFYTFTIEFVADEDYINYYLFVDWAMRCKFGQLSSEMYYHEYTINEFNGYLLDNQKRKRLRCNFRQVALQNISGLSPSGAESEDVVFTASFIAQHLDYYLIKDNIEILNTREMKGI